MENHEHPQLQWILLSCLGLGKDWKRHLSRLGPFRIPSEVASVGFPSFGRKAVAGIRSALFFASQPLRFHLVVDAVGERDVQEALQGIEPWLREKGRRFFFSKRQLMTWWSNSVSCEEGRLLGRLLPLLSTRRASRCVARDPCTGAGGLLAVFQPLWQCRPH